MTKIYSMTIKKTLGEFTAEELADELKKIQDDYRYNWEITKCYDTDSDGYQSFNGLYSLTFFTSVCFANEEEAEKNFNWCKNILDPIQ